MEDEKKYVYVKPKNKITPFAVFNTILFIIISLLILFPLVKVLVDSFDSAAGYGLRLWLRSLHSQLISQLLPV